jgi:cell division cycle 20-like protein 1 (cofactor of APC complex)
MHTYQSLAFSLCSVLYLSMSPDGQSIVTGAGDETLRFWNIFPSAAKGDKVGSPLYPSANHIR